MRSATLHLLNFSTSDTIDIFFDTFRCASDSSYLFNIPKAINSWTLNVLGKGICQDTAQLNLVGSPFFPHVANGNISGHAPNGFNDLPLNTVYNPVVADLTVPQDTSFGQTATLELELVGGISGFDRQVLGCISPSCPNLNGYLKAVIATEQGLVIRNPSTDVKIKMFNTDSAGYIFLNPVYYHTIVPADACVEGDYSYYFDLSNPVFKNVLDSGIFEFTLQACCVAVPVTDYSISFSVLPDPNSCDSLTFPLGHTQEPNCTGLGCTWIPIKIIENHISVHCPGCVTPGMMVDNYILRRTSFGLQDGDNNGLADAVNLPVVPGTTYFNTHNIKDWHSTIGDGLEDLTVSHFQEGDATTTGYTYQQMIDSAGVRLNYLQLSRLIPKGLDTMLVNPLSFTFYIDEPDEITPNCIDCGFFGVDSNEFRTTLAIHVPETSLNLFLDLFPVDNAYLFTFESRWDSLLNQFIGNLHDTSFIVHEDTANPFGGFFESQQYRLHVTYRQCGTKITRYINLFDLDAIALQSEVQNKMWLSGAKQNHDAFGNIPTQPDDMTTLNDSLGLTLFPNDADTSLILIDSTFANEHIFYCSGYGKFHYFFFQNVRSYGTVSNDTSCDKRLVLTSIITTKATNIRAFPFEYRPTPLWANQIEVTVPTGYHISQSHYRSGIYWGANAGQTSWQNFNPPATTGTFLMQDSSYMRPLCFYDPYIQPDSNAYTSSEASNMTYLFTLSSDSCIQPPLIYADSSVIFNIGLNDIPCIVSDSALCAPDPAIVDPSAAYLSEILVTQPNLNAYFINDPLLAVNHQVCFDLVITNYTAPLDSPATIFSTGASNVFLALPDSTSIPFLQNWIYFGSNGDTIIASGQIIPIENYLMQGDSLSGKVCASYMNCQDSIAVPFNVGWNCDGFPFEPFEVDSVCGAISLSVTLEDANVNVTPGPKQHEATYTLCESFEIFTTYSAANFGGYIPELVTLYNLDSSLIPLYAFITFCDSILNDTLSFDTPNSWNISGNNLSAIGIKDSALNFPECLRLTIGLMPNCEFAQVNILPDITLYGQTFCGDTISYGAPFVPESIVQDSSACQGCFILDKIAEQDTVEMLDTVSFDIVICANNSSGESVLLNEYIPSDFTVTSTIPYSVSLPAQGCDTVIVSGYFSTPGPCNGINHINTAQIITSQYDTLTASDCIAVIDSCIALSSLIISDSTFASTFGNDTITNTTFFISGVFFIDTSFTFINCTGYTAANAQIIVLPGATFTLDSTTISGCAFMWPGVTVDSSARMIMQHGSQLKDANVGFTALNSAYLEVVESNIYDCVTGIYAPPMLGMSSTHIVVRGSEFGLDAASFKQDYLSQPTHGNIPKAGIEINNMVMTLGDSLNRNEFFKMNTGIVAYNSRLVVKNSEFRNIAYDSIYTEPFKGTAIVSVTGEGYSGKLTVLPEPTSYNLVHDCFRAIYTDGSVLSVNYVHLIDVYHGIYGTNTPGHQTSHVTGSTIVSNTYGIYWINNRSARSMLANGNYITINGITPTTLSKGFSRTAIFMSETMQQPVIYLATGNEITMHNGNNGIYAGNLAKAKIKFNIVRLEGTSTGIGINNNLYTSISCNSVNGDFVPGSSQKTYGIFTGNSSNHTGIHCNNVDSTFNGIFFTGPNPNTVMKGNEMNTHEFGLYLTFPNTIIGKQPHHGNKWNGPIGNFGAINLSPTLMSLSRFDVDSSLGVSFNPTVNPLTGWFFTNPDTSNLTFDCDNSTVCDLPPPSLSTEIVNELIASGELLTEESAEETQAIVEEYLYRELQEDSVLRYSDSLFIEFMLDHETDAVAYLFNAEEYVRSAYEMDSVFISLIDQANSQIEQYTDSISGIDEGLYTDEYREYWLYQIEFLNQTIRNLEAQNTATMEGDLSSAEYFNDIAIADEVPEQNTQYINDLELRFIDSGMSPETIDESYAEILAIAHQCPSTGGPAVERARAFIALINDSVEYYDDDVCLQVGVYREIQATIDEQTINNIKIIPNPANNKIEIVVSGSPTGICKIKISDALGKEVLTSMLKCESLHEPIDISKLIQGVYSIDVEINGVLQLNSKLVIVR